MIATNSITNEERAAFLRSLDKSALAMTDWEAKFIGSFLQANRWWDWFTPGRVKSTGSHVVEIWAADPGNAVSVERF